MQTIGRKLWGDVWAPMLIMLGMGLACFVTAIVYKYAPNLWYAISILYFLIAVSLVQNSKITTKQAIFYCTTASLVSLAIIGIIIRL